MLNYSSQIEKIKKVLSIIQPENFKPSLGGTHYNVFISEKYIIRFRDDSPKILLREAGFLKKLNHPLIPKVLWVGKVDQSFAMVENRLPGQTIDSVWKNISTTNKANIIKQVIEFLQYQKTQAKNYIYSVNTGKKYEGFLGYLSDNINQKIATIEKFKQTAKTMKDLLLIINKLENKSLFANKSKIALVHGDLIVHNLLTDGKNLTGVIDWELALFGDPDYDLFRLFYYQECAKAYQEQGIDDTFEADYMDNLIKVILQVNFVGDKKVFQKKYQFARAIFYLNAFYWAANSDDPKKNFKELITQWNKKNGVKLLRT